LPVVVDAAPPVAVGDVLGLDVLVVVEVVVVYGTISGITAPPAIDCFACPRLNVDGVFVASSGFTSCTVPFGSVCVR
jgi:hypothetical protein